MKRVRELLGWAGVSWARLLGVLVLVLVSLVGTLGADRGNPHAAFRQLDLLGAGLVCLAAGAFLLSAHWPFPAYGVSASATVTYVALGYGVSSPFLLGWAFTTAAAVVWDRPLRSAALFLAGATWPLVSGLVYAAHGSHPLVPLIVGGWSLLPIAIGHVVGYRQWQVERSVAAERDREMRGRIAEERLRIARELHDVVSHTISVINVQAGAAAHVIDDHPEEAKKALEQIRQSSKEALRELQAVLGVLRDAGAPEARRPAPGIESVPVLVETARAAGLAVNVSTVGKPVAVPPAVGLSAYRVVQEAFTNVIRHAGARSVAVRIEYAPEELRLEVADDGRGAAANGRRQGGGHGLVGMRERVTSAGGSLEAKPRQGGGFLVRAVLPLRPRP